MGVANVPSAAGGGIKLVQRGSAGGSGNVTITAVDVNKAFVHVFGTASSGTVAATGAVGATTITNAIINGQKTNGGSPGGTGEHRYIPSGVNSLGGNPSAALIRIPSYTDNVSAANISGGSNNLVAAVVQGYLSNSTTLVVSGACRWEVVEFA